jgi:Aminoglycoside-2''-adenylyltransferase
MEQLAALAQLHDRFERHGIEYWLFGGWAVDFHAGAVTRPHADLDAAVWLEDDARIAELLQADGWVHSPRADEDGSTLYVRGEVRLELAFLARADDGEVYTPVRDGRAAWAPGAFEDDVAELGGVRARVISLRALKEEKSGPRDDATASAKDRADLATLADL